jgi:UDP-N-acetylglucosamine--N-acetylmuramyl-(pentapeptide) pyrophosphoryl-undecaprenol N-acetylglucosamine transferase
MYVLDVVPGKTLIALEPFATTIYCCFESTKQYFSGKHVFSAPYPVRYLSSEINCTKKDACIHLGLDPKKKTLFILGGSQGSTFLNELIMKWVCDNARKSHNIQIIHQYGNDTRHDWNIWYAQHQQKAVAFDFASNLSFHYAASDLVIARAGAGTIFELQAFNKKTILIPLQALSTDHQVDNAKSIVKMYPETFSFLVQADVEKNRDELYQKINDSLQ